MTNHNLPIKPEIAKALKEFSQNTTKEYKQILTAMKPNHNLPKHKKGFAR